MDYVMGFFKSDIGKLVGVGKVFKYVVKQIIF